MSKIIYHGSNEIVKFPEVRKSIYTKDFSWGFYCTNDHKQAYRWASRNPNGVVNHFSYQENPNLRILKFAGLTEDWLDFIAKCRSGFVHDYDIVEGPMADDTIWNFVNDYLLGNISRNVFWEYAKFKYPTHQISFHTLKALDCITYIKSDILK